MNQTEAVRVWEFEEHWQRGSAALRMSGKYFRGEYGVWLELAGALPGKEQIIPKAGGRKYDWEKKLVFRLSSEDLGRIGWGLAAERIACLVAACVSKNELEITIDGPARFFVSGQEGASGKEEGKKISVLLDGDGFWKLRQCVRIGYEGVIWLQNEFEERKR
jgi:hypothetical protein